MATTETKTFKNFIGGEWVEAGSGETFESKSPATGELVGVFPKSGPEDADRAVAAAKDAYEEWRLVPAPKRGEILFRFARLLEEAKDDLTDLMTREMGKVKAEAGGDGWGGPAARTRAARAVGAGSAATRAPTRAWAPRRGW